MRSIVLAPPLAVPPRGMRALRAAALGAATAAITAAAPAGPLFVAGRASGFLESYLPGASVVVWLVPLAIVVMASRRGRHLSSRDRTAIQVGYLIGVTVFLLVLLKPLTGGWRDASAYYTLGLDDPYGVAYAAGGIRYAPAFFQVTEPLRWLGWPEFLFLWTAVQLTALWIMAGPIAPALLLIPLVALEVWFSNINILLALAITLGFRWPALWSIVLLTKITPGVGLLWFAVRREWLRAITSATPPDRVLDLGPLAVRLALAAAVVAVGALRDRPWTVPIAATIAMPVLWPTTLAVLVAVVPLSRAPWATGKRRAADWAIGGRLPVRPGSVPR